MGPEKNRYEAQSYARPLTKSSARLPSTLGRTDSMQVSRERDTCIHLIRRTMIAVT
jgi:hypothetical protein